MNRLALFFVLSFIPLSISCDLDVGPDSPFPGVPHADDGILSDTLKSLYHKDAARLAVRYQLQGPLEDRVEIESSLQESFYSALVRVWSSLDDPARKTVGSIHTFPDPNLEEVVIAADSSLPWMQNLRRGDSLSGNAAFDALMVQYSLRVNYYYAWPTHHTLVVRAEEPLNTAALALQFGALSGVVYAEPNGAVGDGNDIKAVGDQNRWRLDYSVGWGDCPAGCTAHHYWTFAVDTLGSVEFLGEWGTPL